MKNLRNPTRSSLPSDFESLGKKYSNLFSDAKSQLIACEKIRTTRQSLHRYIFVILHTIQHFGHHLTAMELKLVQNECEQTLQWMWHSETKSLEDYRQKILQLRRICTPLMQQLFQAEQLDAIDRDI